jgi:CRP-like cAMP-binding protein
VSNRTALSNSILQGLPTTEFKKIFPRLKLVTIPLHSVLSRESKTIEHGYFMNGGLASVLMVLKNGKIVEVGLTGAEGFVGLPLIAGLKSSAVRVIAQVKGSAYRISTKNMMTALGRCPELRKSLQRYEQDMGAQAAQIAACNRLHDAKQRMARWILMSHDRLGGDRLHLTHEFLAHMLGMRRASVTVALGFLQRRNLIKYTRGTVEIRDRLRLEAAACECYSAIVKHHARWQKESKARRRSY